LIGHANATAQSVRVNVTTLALFIYIIRTGAVSFFEYQKFLVKQHGSIIQKTYYSYTSITAKNTKLIIKM
jgi:hypothetical protein